MDKNIFAGNIENISRQRNLFVLLTLILSASLLMVTFRLWQESERVVVVPGLSKSAWIDGQGVSASYLEEMANMYLPYLLDLNSQNIDWRKNKILEHVSRSDSRYLEAINEYFVGAKEQYSQFDLTTFFAAKRFQISERDKKVVVSGQLISQYGNEGFDVQPARYLMKFDWVGGKLSLKSFERLTDER